jgi:type I restriction enzyme M protein
MPTPDNGNYIWIQIFYSALNPGGRTGFVMANSASDARGTEMEIRKKIIEAGEVDVMVAVGSNFFSTVTLPCTLWFFDKGKKATDRQDRVLFLDARHIFKQVDRAHREFTPEQIQYLAYIVRLYRDEEVEDFIHYIDSAIDYLKNYETSDEQKARDILERLSITEALRSQWQAQFEGNSYQDIPGLCRAATLSEIEAQGWSLNPGRYVGVAEREEEDFDFSERLEELNEELEVLNVEARGLEERIAENVEKLLEGEN